VVTEAPHVNSILVAASGFMYAPTSSNNLGDRAQLTRSVERLREAFPDSRFIAIANSLNDMGDFDDIDVSYSAIRYLMSPPKVPMLRLLVPVRATRALRVVLLLVNARRLGRTKSPVFLSEAGHVALGEMEQGSALFMSGAGTFNDLYISGAGGLWGVLGRCMSVLGKPVVASGQQIGPLRRFSRRALVRWALRPVDLLGVRDPRSAASALAVKVPEQRVVLTGDDAWDLAPAASATADRVLAKGKIRGPFIVAQMRFGSSVGWDEADSRTFAASLDRLSLEFGMPVVFVPCMTGRGADDRYAAACVQQHLKARSWALADELDARTTKAILGKAVLGVGTANHFCVFAASMGTPVVGVHASPYMEQKITGIAELWPKRVVAVSKETGLDPSALLAAARQLLERQVDGTAGADEDQPPVEVHPGEPIRFLERLLLSDSPTAHGPRGHRPSEQLTQQRP
jgi:polysaccharide pyruvyl transferase WcaK-like protein